MQCTGGLNGSFQLFTHTLSGYSPESTGRKAATFSEAEALSMFQIQLSSQFFSHGKHFFQHT